MEESKSYFDGGLLHGVFLDVLLQHVHWEFAIHGLLQCFTIGRQNIL